MATDERAREIIAASAALARAEAEEWEARRQHNQSWDHLDAARERLHTATAEEWDALLTQFHAQQAAWDVTDGALDRAYWDRKRASWKAERAH